jgi:hypothetical protein
MRWGEVRWFAGLPVPWWCGSGAVLPARSRKQSTTAPHKANKNPQFPPHTDPPPNPRSSPPIPTPAAPPRFAPYPDAPAPRGLGAAAFGRRADGAARGQQVPPRAQARERLLRGDLPRFVPPAPTLNVLPRCESSRFSPLYPWFLMDSWFVWRCCCRYPRADQRGGRD